MAQPLKRSVFFVGVSRKKKAGENCFAVLKILFVYDNITMRHKATNCFSISCWNVEPNKKDKSEQKVSRIIIERRKNVMIQGFLAMSGQLILLLVYGKNNPKMPAGGIVTTLSIAFVFWLVCLLILFESINSAALIDILLGALYAIGFPVAIAVWAYIERKKRNKEEIK